MDVEVPEILLKLIKPAFPDVLDSGDAANQLKKAVAFIRKMSAARITDRTNANVPSLGQEVSPPAQNLSRLRIVVLGVKYSECLFHALE